MAGKESEKSDQNEKDLKHAEAEKKIYSDASVATTVDAIRELRTRAKDKREKRGKS